MAVEELLRRVTALKDFAVRVGRNPVLEDELAQKFQKLPPQSLHDISRIANLIDDSFGEKKSMLLDILHGKVATTAASGKNRTLQTWKELAKYLHKAQWDMILDASVPRTHVMREIVKHMYEVLGLRYPSEVTMGYLSILVSFKEYEGLDVEKFPAFFQYHQQMKSEIVLHLESLRKKANPAAESKSLLMILPENPEDLHYLSAFAQEKAAPPMVDLGHLHHMVSVLPLRKTHRHAGNAPSSSSSLAMAFNRQQNLQQVQAAAAFANMFAGMNFPAMFSGAIQRPGEQLPPGFKMFDQQGGSSQKSPQLALPAPVSQNPEASSCSQAPGAQQHQMVEKHDVQKSDLVEAKQVVAPTTYVNPAVPALQDPPDDKDKVAVDPGVANHEAAEAMAAVSQALERRDDDKRMKRPASVQKKPAAMKRPSASLPTSTSSSVQKKDLKKADKKGVFWKGNITQKERIMKAAVPADIEEAVQIPAGRNGITGLSEHAEQRENHVERFCVGGQTLRPFGLQNLQRIKCCGPFPHAAHWAAKCSEKQIGMFLLFEERVTCLRPPGLQEIQPSEKYDICHFCSKESGSRQNKHSSTRSRSSKLCQCLSLQSERVWLLMMLWRRSSWWWPQLWSWSRSRTSCSGWRLAYPCFWTAFDLPRSCTKTIRLQAKCLGRVRAAWKRLHRTFWWRGHSKTTPRGAPANLMSMCSCRRPSWSSKFLLKGKSERRGKLFCWVSFWWSRFANKTTRPVPFTYIPLWWFWKISYRICIQSRSLCSRRLFDGGAQKKCLTCWRSKHGTLSEAAHWARHVI